MSGVVVVLLAACRGRERERTEPLPVGVATGSAVGVAGAATDEIDAAPAPSFAGDANPAVRALGAAIDRIDVDAARRFVGGSDADAPAELVAAVEALVAWNAAGAPAVHIECVGIAADERATRLSFVARAALAQATSQTDDRVMAALRMGASLWAGDDDPQAMWIGAGIADDATARFAKRGWKTIPPSLSPDDQHPWRVLQAEERCMRRVIESAVNVAEITPAAAALRRELGLPPDVTSTSMEVSMPLLHAAMLGQRRLKARTREELARSVDEAIAESEQSPHMAIRRLGSPLYTRRVLTGEYGL
jgi:hypothetical protein